MGKIIQKTNVNKSKGEEVEAYCSRCQGETDHIVLQSVERDGEQVIGYHDGRRDQPATVDWYNHYQIIQCLGCKDITFRHVTWCSEAMGPLGYGGEYDDGTTTYLYPKRSEKTRKTKEYYNVPPIIQRIYKEMLECFNNELVTLCAAGLRATIEGICADQKIEDGLVETIREDGSKVTHRQSNLAGKIAGLEEKGILTKGNSTILHEHRFLGNEAVHQLDQPSRDELVLAIEILEHTLDALYEVPDKAEELKRIKAKRLKKKLKR